MVTYMRANSIFDGSITNLISIPCSSIEVLSRAYAKGRKGLINYKFDTFIDRFPSDSAASMAVKGLNKALQKDRVTHSKPHATRAR